ncbi:MAG: 30S ribosomal protein S20 [Candidatus Margulisiibacteriota bacterium]
MAEKKKVTKRKHVKNVRQTKRRHERNVAEKTKLKTVLKAARQAIAAKAADMIERVRLAVSVLDKAAERQIIHKNKASRLKSRLALTSNQAK